MLRFNVGVAVRDGSSSLELPTHASSVGAARRLVGDALNEAGLDTWVDDAQLAVSELVTNALVHAGSAIKVRVHTDTGRVRVEVSDGSHHPPAPRHYSAISGTGRGLHLIDVVAERWGVDYSETGKTVWFELGEEMPPDTEQLTRSDRPVEAADDTLVIDLLNFPLLMHQAWQEHASALLREFLLVHLDDESSNAFEQHARASDAMNLLNEQAPAPPLADDPDAIMATAIEPGISAAKVSLCLPRASLSNFQTLDDMLDAAATLALRGDLLVPPAQPEVREMREWICAQVRQQSTGVHAPRPWSPDTDAARREEIQSTWDWDDAEVSGSQRLLIATDERSVIVAVSPAALAFLRYDSAEDLVGRRIIRVVPSRYHQAHIAGTTMHMINGRDALLDVRITVPVTRRDDSEEPVSLVVHSHPLPHGHRLFLAELFAEPDGDVSTVDPPSANHLGAPPLRG